jgi:hypothetical protein
MLDVPASLDPCGHHHHVIVARVIRTFRDGGGGSILQVFIGLYKPDAIADSRCCPSCSAEGDQYWTDGEVNDAVRRPPMTKVVT